MEAQACLQRGEMTKAAEWCEQGIEVEHDSLQLHLTLGRAKAIGGDLKGACECLERCVALHPDDYSVRAELGNLYLRRHQYGAAIEQFRAVLRNDATSAPVWLNLLRWRTTTSGPSWQRGLGKRRSAR